METDGAQPDPAGTVEVLPVDGSADDVVYARACLTDVLVSVILRILNEDQ